MRLKAKFKDVLLSSKNPDELKQIIDWTAKLKDDPEAILYINGTGEKPGIFDKDIDGKLKNPIHFDFWITSITMEGELPYKGEKQNES